jgi:hypothetical protein
MKNLFTKRGCSDVAVDHDAQQFKLHRDALDGNALEAFNAAYDLREEEDVDRQPADPDDPRTSIEWHVSTQALDECDDAAVGQRHYLTHRISMKSMDIRQWSNQLA